MTIIKQPPVIHTAFNPAMLEVSTDYINYTIDISVKVNDKTVTRSREAIDKKALFDLSGIVKREFQDKQTVISQGRVFTDSRLFQRYSVEVDKQILEFTALNAVSQIGESSDFTNKKGTFLTAFERPKKYKGYELHLSYLGFNGQTIIRTDSDVLALVELEHATIIVPDNKQSISIATGGSFVPLLANVKPPTRFKRSLKSSSEVAEILFKYKNNDGLGSLVAMAIEEFLPDGQSEKYVYVGAPVELQLTDDAFSNGSTGKEFLTNFKNLVESKHYAKENLIFDFIDDNTLRVRLKESSKNKYRFSADGPIEPVSIDDGILGSTAGGGEDTEVITNNLGEIIYVRKLDGTFEQRIIYIDQPCMPTNPFYVRWINRLGGYDYWMFSYRQYITRGLGEVITFKPTMFDQENATDYKRLLSIEAIEKITVGSSNVTANEYEAISKLIYAPVLEWYNEKLKKWLPIQVEDGENTNDTRTGLKHVEFTFYLPDVQTQF